MPFKEISCQYFQAGVSASQARIQDAIKEGQELVVQVEKEERGNKGAALTTFISPRPLCGADAQQPRGGGVSARIEGDDRAELKENMDQLGIPQRHVHHRPHRRYRPSAPGAAMGPELPAEAVVCD